MDAGSGTAPSDAIATPLAGLDPGASRDVVDGHLTQPLVRCRAAVRKLAPDARNGGRERPAGRNRLVPSIPGRPPVADVLHPMSRGRRALRLHVHLISDSTGETVTTVARAGGLAVRGRGTGRACLVLRPHARSSSRRCWPRRGAAGPGHLHAGLARAASSAAGALPAAEHAVRAGAGQRDERPWRGCWARRAGRRSAASTRWTRAILPASPPSTTHAARRRPVADDLEDADVVLVGVSRTSKTPTCVYLANRGVKAANVPLVPSCRSSIGRRAERPLIVGLTINPESLAHIRRTRQRMLGLEHGDQDGSAATMRTSIESAAS